MTREPNHAREINPTAIRHPIPQYHNTYDKQSVGNKTM